MTDLIERLVPDELCVVFRRVVPTTEVIRPQAAGRRRASDREALAAIIFVATSGSTWRQHPPVFGPSGQTVYRRFAQWSRARVWARLHRMVLDELGARGGASWTGRGVRSIPSAWGRQKGATGRTESDRSRQAQIENSPDHRPERTATVPGYLRREHARQPGPGAARARHPTHPVPPRPLAATPGEAARRQGLRL